MLSQPRPLSIRSSAHTLGGLLLLGSCALPSAIHAQRGPDRDWNAPTRIERGTVVPVRTDETIDADRTDGRVFTGIVDQDVRDETGRLAILRGSSVELMVRVAPDQDLIVDLDSVVVNGQRYAIRADAERVDAPPPPAPGRTGEHIGEGALLGTLIGAIAGGGKGAVIGAAAGAAVGAGIITHGRAIRVPRDAVLTFRLERPLDLGVQETGFSRDGRHFHDVRDRSGARIN